VKTIRHGLGAWEHGHCGSTDREQNAEETSAVDHVADVAARKTAEHRDDAAQRAVEERDGISARAPVTE